MTALPLLRQDTGQLLRLMAPILLTQVAQAGYGLIDTVMAGQVSATDLAAVAIGAGLWLPVLLLCLGVLSATTPLVAGQLGAGQSQKVVPLVQQGLWVALGVGAPAYLIPRMERSYAAIERVIDEIDRLSLERKVAPTLSVWRDALDAVQGPEQGRLL